MISFVQSASNSVNSGGTLIVTLSSSPVNGNTILVTVADSTNNASVSMTGGSFVEDTTIPYFGGRIFRLSNISGGGATITITGDVAEMLRGIAFEVSGLDKSHPLDQLTQVTGSGSNPDSGTVTTTVADEFLLACWTSNITGSLSGPTNGFTGFINESSGGTLPLGAAYKIVSATGSADSSVTATASGTWVGTMATYRVPIISSNSLMMLGVGI